MGKRKNYRDFGKHRIFLCKGQQIIWDLQGLRFSYENEKLNCCNKIPFIIQRFYQSVIIQ